MPRVFLLSPASCGGARGRRLLSPDADFALARTLRSRDGASLGDLFSFISGLYFRGKLTYARRFAAPPHGMASGVGLITPSSGLRGPDERITRETLEGFAGVDIDPANARYRRPLEASARALRAEVGSDCDVVLLGSVATPKYVEVLADIFGGRLLFPIDFVGRGDMSRGGLLLRRVREGVELEYAPLVGAVRHGTRPPRLATHVSAHDPA